MLEDFEWDEAKAISNKTKHGISFEDAAYMFLDPLRVDRVSEKNYKETRRVAIGLALNRILFVAYIVRNGKVRIISARRASRDERREYYRF